MKTLIGAALRCSLILLVPSATYAIDAQWNLDPISGDWNTAANWTPNDVPNGPADVATFGLSNTTNVSISTNTEVNSLVFTSGAANPYTITSRSNLTLTISGAGIINNSGIAQHFLTGGLPTVSSRINFTNNADAGDSTICTNRGFGFTQFFDNSTAAHAVIINKGSITVHVGNGGETQFGGTSSAGHAVITNEPAGASDAGGGGTVFFANSTAASATITNEGGTISTHYSGGGSTAFIGSPDGNVTAGNAVLINNGATINGAHGGHTFFIQNCSAGNATIIANRGQNG
jgi:hypothetical protein